MPASWIKRLAKTTSRSTAAPSLQRRTHGHDEDADGDGVGWPNMDTMRDLLTPAMLHNLRRRYASGMIYTSTGPILVAVNPFTPLPLYGDSAIKAYSAADVVPLPPHVFGAAANAYNSMVASGKNQALVISGESGAGKTETTKLLLKFLACTAAAAPRRSVSASRVSFHVKSTGGVEDAVMQSNPLTEAFGNAKTARNNNSSRFGKFIQLLFKRASTTKPVVCGASIVPYLLEKTRISHSASSERNYHIFYQLLAPGALEPSERRRLGLLDGEDATSFAYLNHGASARLEGVDDGDEFAATSVAFARVGFRAADQEALFRVLIGVLLLGNSDMGADADGNSTAGPAVVDGVGDALSRASACLGLDRGSLATALTTRKISGPRDQVFYKPLTPDHATSTRDALAREVYSRLFKWLIHHINTRLAPPTFSSECTVIGVLDIYGFEALETNALTQVFINYTNEKLQAAFNFNVFTSEMNEYDREGIHLSAADKAGMSAANSPCIELLEGTPLGVFSLMAEEARLATGTDGALLRKLAKAHSNTPTYGVCGMSTKWKGNADTNFVIQHYAGPVQYTITGFVVGNRDTLLSLVVDALAASRIPLVAMLFAAGSPFAPPPPKYGGFTVVSSHFCKQMTALMDSINSMASWWIRCIKPNSSALPFVFDGPRVLEQLRYGGMLEALRVRAQGFPNRFPYLQFLRRYGVFLDWDSFRHVMRAGGGVDGAPGSGDLLRRMVSQVMTHPDVAPYVGSDGYQLGHTKVFLRNDVLFMLDAAMQDVQASAAEVIQAWYRGIHQYQWFQHARVSARVMQRVVRGFLGRRAAATLVDTLKTNRKKAALRHTVSTAAAARLHARDDTRARLMGADADLRAVYTVVGLGGEALLTPPLWHGDADVVDAHNKDVVKLDVGRFLFDLEPPLGVSAADGGVLHRHHKAAVQSLGSALTALAEYEAAELEVATTLDAMGSMNTDDIPALQKRLRVMESANVKLSHVQPLMEAAAVALSTLQGSVTSLRDKVLAVAAATAARELAAMRAEEERQRFVEAETLRLYKEAIERDAQAVADNRAGMEREDNDRKALLTLVTQVYLRARMESNKRVRERQARELVIMRREDAFSDAVRQEVAEALEAIAVARAARRRKARAVRNARAVAELRVWAAGVAEHVREEVLRRQEYMERISMSAEDVRVRSGVLGGHLHTFYAGWEEAANKQEQETMAAMQSLRMAAADVSRTAAANLSQIKAAHGGVLTPTPTPTPPATPAFPPTFPHATALMSPVDAVSVPPRTPWSPPWSTSVDGPGWVAPLSFGDGAYARGGATWSAETKADPRGRWWAGQHMSSALKARLEDLEREEAEVEAWLSTHRATVAPPPYATPEEQPSTHHEALYAAMRERRVLLAQEADRLAHLPRAPWVTPGSL